LTRRGPSIIVPAPRVARGDSGLKKKDFLVVSSTKQTRRRRRLRASQRGRWNKTQAETPKFPVHPDGYDAAAADAKKPKAGDDAAQK
jgi:hypothetical protein